MGMNQIKSAHLTIEFDSFTDKIAIETEYPGFEALGA
jgi:hypothetical protein